MKILSHKKFQLYSILYLHNDIGVNIELCTLVNQPQEFDSQYYWLLHAPEAPRQSQHCHWNMQPPMQWQQIHPKSKQLFIRLQLLYTESNSASEYLSGEVDISSMFQQELDSCCFSIITCDIKW